MSELTAFQNACAANGWDKPADFLRAFQAAADVLTEPVTLTDRQFRRWKQPAPPMPRARAWRVLHAMFGVSPAELGFPGPPPGVTVESGLLLTQRGSSGVDRRAFVNSIGAAAAAIVPAAPAHLRPLTPPGRGGAIGTAQLLELREGLRSLYHLDDAYGGCDVRSLATRHLRRVRRVLNNSKFPETIGRQLQLLAGETAEHCGWLHYDAEDQDEARRYWGEALTTATMLRDANLELLVFASMSLQAVYEGRPRDGLDLARAAQERATKLGSPVLQSIIAVREARALTLMTDARTGSKRLAEAMRLMEHSDRGRPTPAWAAFHGAAELDYAQGLLYAEQGHHHAASQFLRAALDHQDRSYGRNRALYRLTLAQNLIHDDEVDEAAAYAVESMEHLEEVESGRVMRMLTKVTGLLDNVDAVSAREAADELKEYAHMKGAA
ncbi:hypothetical protein ABZ543_07965 [Streptomyces roseifaciens]